MPSQPKQSLLISTEAPEIRIAQLRDNRLFDLFVERGGRLLNNVFKGRVANVITGMDAAFIDIGLHRNALIYAGDIVSGNSLNAPNPANSIGNLVKVGDQLIVQVARPPIGTKGARVTTKLSLAGRYVVVTQYDDKTGVSRRIDSDEERTRLRRLAEKLRPLDHGLILRTEAEGASENALAKDVQAVVALMQKIRTTAATTQAPSLIHREAGVLGRIIRDRFNESIEEIWIDTIEEFEVCRMLVRDIAPALAERIHFYDGKVPLFRKYGIDTDIATAQERTVVLPHGGTLVIDETEALCAIDVNTGKFTGKTRLIETVLQTNLEAVEAAARQIRLRNLGGIIVIDFIDMERQKDRIQVLDALEAALKQDHNRTRIIQLSPSGLVEITRRRESPSLRQLLNRPCPYCEGVGVIGSPATIAVEARRQVRQWIQENPEFLVQSQEMEVQPVPDAKEITEQLVCVTLHPEAACAFLGPANEYILNLEKSIGIHIWLRADPSFHQEAIHIAPFSLGQIEDDMPPTNLTPQQTIKVPIQIGRYPQKEPQFIVQQNRLILLENMREFHDKDGKNRDILIGEVGRWYATGRILDKTDE